MDPHTTLFFLCDIQAKFKTGTYGYDHVVVTANKLIKLAKIFSCPVLCTTHNAKTSGPIDPNIDLSSLESLLVGVYNKTLFSMLTPEVKTVLNGRSHIKSIVLFGIESHICILQTVLDLVSHPNGYSVYIVADGVSSSHHFEVPIAIARLCREGAIITTSESLGFQLMKDDGSEQSETFNQMVEEEKENTRRVGEVLVEGTSSAVFGKSLMYGIWSCICSMM